jgi:hypothetical protein
LTSAERAAEYAAECAEYAAEYAAECAEYAAECAEYAAESAAEPAAECAECAAERAAECAECAAERAEYAAERAEYAAECAAERAEYTSAWVASPFKNLRETFRASYRRLSGVRPFFFSRLSARSAQSRANEAADVVVQFVLRTSLARLTTSLSPLFTISPLTSTSKIAGPSHLTRCAGSQR